MRSSILFWGFQDLNFVSDFSKKIRHTLNIKDFYVQINDLEKTISLMDLYPEEVIRTKYDMINLYNWLSRSSQTNILVLVDMFNFLNQENFEENCLSLTKVLALNFQFCFVSPKILNPQGLKFTNNFELSSIYQKTIEYHKMLKKLYEIIINSNSQSSIIPIPVPQMVVLNRDNYFLFESKTIYKLTYIPKILKQFNTSYISHDCLISKIVESISKNLMTNDVKRKVLLQPIEPDSSTQFTNLSKNAPQYLKIIFSISLERFFKLKSSSVDLNFILWLLYLSICEYEVQCEQSKSIPILADFYFSKPSSQG